MRPPGALNWKIWAGLVAAPLAWVIHHQVGSDLNFARCEIGNGGALSAIGLGALVIILVGGVMSFLGWRQAGGPGHEGQEPVARFIAILGMMSAGLFSLTLLMQIAAAVVLPSCFR